MSETRMKKDEEILRYIRFSSITLSFEDDEIQMQYNEIQNKSWPKQKESIFALFLIIFILIYLPYYSINEGRCFSNFIFQIVLAVPNIFYILKPMNRLVIKKQLIIIQTIHFFIFFIFFIIPEMLENDRSDRNQSQNQNDKNNCILTTHTGISLIIIMMIAQLLLSTWYERGLILWIITLCDQLKSSIYSSSHFFIQYIILLIIITYILYIQERQKRERFFIRLWQQNLLQEWKDIWKNTIPTPIIIVGISKDDELLNEKMKIDVYKKKQKQINGIPISTEKQDVLIMENAENKNIDFPQSTLMHNKEVDDIHHNNDNLQGQNINQTSIRQKNRTLNAQLIDSNFSKSAMIVNSHMIEESPPDREKHQFPLQDRNGQNNLRIQDINMKQNQLNMQNTNQNKKSELIEERKRADSYGIKGNQNDNLMNNNNNNMNDKINNNHCLFHDKKSEEEKQDKDINLENELKHKEEMNNIYSNDDSYSMSLLSKIQFKEANNKFINTFNLNDKTNLGYQDDLKRIMTTIKDTENVPLFSILQILLSENQSLHIKSSKLLKSQMIKQLNQLTYLDKYFEAKLIECDWDDSQRSVVIVFNDITEKVMNEKKEQQYQYKDQILAIATHDLKTPLNNITCSIESMKLSLDMQNIQEQLELASVCAQQMANVIHDILDYSAINKGSLRLNMEVFRLSDLIQKIFALFKLHAQLRNIELKYDIDPTLQLEDITSDPRRLVQILNNLIANSLKFTMKGYILIKFKANPHDSNIIHISISDTGVGIPQKYVDQIFKPFQSFNHTSHLNSQGIGLGLIICKTLVRMLGPSQQRIGLKTEENKGSKICFDLYKNINEKQENIQKINGTLDNDQKSIAPTNRDKKITLNSSPQKQSCEALLLCPNTNRSAQSPLIGWTNNPTQEINNNAHKRVIQLKVNEKYDSSCAIRENLEQEPVVQLVKYKQPISSVNLFTQVSLPSQAEFNMNSHPSDIQMIQNQKQSLKYQQQDGSQPSNSHYVRNNRNNNVIQQQKSNINVVEPSITPINSSQITVLNSGNLISQNNITSLFDILNQNNAIEKQPDNNNNNNIEKDSNNQQNNDIIQSNPYNNNNIDLKNQQKIYHQISNNQYDQELIKNQQNDFINNETHTPQNKFTLNLSHINEQNISPNSNIENTQNSPLNQQIITNQFNQTIQNYSNNNNSNNNNNNNINNFNTKNKPMSKFYSNMTPNHSKNSFANNQQNISQTSTPKKNNYISSFPQNISNKQQQQQQQQQQDIGAFSNVVYQQQINQNVTIQNIQYNYQNNDNSNNNIINSNNNQQQQNLNYTNYNYITPVLGEVNEEINDSSQNSQKGQSQSLQLQKINNSINILIVDDEFVHYKVLSQVLSCLNHLSFKFDYAPNGQEALLKMKQSPYIYEMIFVDGNMPIMNGFQFTRKVRLMERENQYQQKTHLIGITGGGDQDKSLFLFNGADYYFQKPVDMKNIQDYIKKYIASKSNNN